MNAAGIFRCSIRCVGSITVCACLILLFSVKPAHAYLDPGTGSMILQLLLGGIAGALVVGKLYFQKIKLFFAGLFGFQPGDQGHTDED